MIQGRIGPNGRPVAGVRPLAACCSLTVVLSFGGCSYTGDWLHNGFKVGPDYCRPAASVADEWIDFNDRRVVSEGVDEVGWWRMLGDPKIDQLVQTSYEQNLPLRVAGLRVLEAQAVRAVAVGNLFPQTQTAFGEYQRIQLSKNGNPIGVVAAPVRAFDFWTTGFNLAWEVDVWGRFRRGIESSDARLDASVEDYDDILVSLIAETATAYVQVREFQERLKYARANVKSQKGSLKLAEARFRNGAVGELDVTQAKSVMGQTQALVPFLEARLREANNRLCVLLGVPPRDLGPELGEGPIPDAPTEAVVGIPAELLRRRPDIRRAEREVAAQSARIGIAAADLFPAFSINGSINWQAAEFRDLLRSASNAGNIGPSFNWNILNYGRLVNTVEAERARFQQLAVEYQQTVLQANAEVEDALVTFLKAQEEVKAFDYSVDATRRSVELALIKYREGAIDFDRVFNLQSTLVQQQDRLAAAQAKVVIGLIRIFRALGGGWQIRQGFGVGPADANGGIEAVPLPPPPDPAEAGDRNADAKAGNGKDADAKAGDAKDADAKVGDTKPGDAKAGDAKAPKLKPIGEQP